MERIDDVQVLVIGIRSDSEARMIAESLPSEVKSVMVSVETWDQFRQALREHVAPIVHIVGRSPGADAVELEDTYGAMRRAVPHTLGQCQEELVPVEVVVLDGCYDRAQARPWLRHVNAVIGIPESVPVGGGAAGDALFASELYRALARKRTMADAFDTWRTYYSIELLMREDSADTAAQQISAGPAGTKIRLTKGGEEPRLYDLLRELRRGYMMYRPILVDVMPGPIRTSDRQPGGTVSADAAVFSFWVLTCRTMFAEHRFLVLGENVLAESLEAPVVIGRSRRCDVRIDDGSVSEVHASVVFDRASGEYLVVDEHSRNRTRINGEALTPGVPTPVCGGDWVRFGNARFVFLDPPMLRKMAEIGE